MADRIISEYPCDGTQHYDSAGVLNGMYFGGILSPARFVERNSDKPWGGVESQEALPNPNAPIWDGKGTLEDAQQINTAIWQAAHAPVGVPPAHDYDAAYNAHYGPLDPAQILTAPTPHPGGLSDQEALLSGAQQNAPDIMSSLFPQNQIEDCQPDESLLRHMLDNALSYDPPEPSFESNIAPDPF